MPMEPAAGLPSLTSDENIERVTIGPVTPHDAPIVLVPYDPRWPALFAREASRIRAALGSLAIRVAHVGSTSVPGLAAKPIIDIVLVVPDSADEPAYVPPLEAAGYVLRAREPGWFEHRLLEGPQVRVSGGLPGASARQGLSGGVPSTLLHVFSTGATEIDRMIAFRDWLRTHDAERDAYLHVKRELAQRTWRHVQHYADAKTAIVQQILARAAAAGRGPAAPAAS